MPGGRLTVFPGAKCRAPIVLGAASIRKCVGLAAQAPVSTASGGMRRTVRRGFTMLELLVVMAILALVAGVVAPSVGLVGHKGGLKSAVRKIGGAVHEARTHAGRTRAWAELSIMGGALIEEGEDAGDYTPIVLKLTGRDIDGEPVDLGRVELPEGVELHDVLVESAGEEEHEEFDPEQPVALHFHPRGLTLPAAVRLESGDDAATVCVYPVAGVALIEDFASLEQCKREK